MHRSRHHEELLDPGAGQRLLAENGKWVRDRLARNGVPDEAIEKHLSVIGNPPAMEAALAWYRARGERAPSAPPGCRPCSTGARLMTRLAASRPKGLPNSSRRITASCPCRASAITQPTRCRRRSTTCFSTTSPATRYDR